MSATLESSEAKRSNNNPFRTPTVTPNPTGTSTSPPATSAAATSGGPGSIGGPTEAGTSSIQDRHVEERPLTSLTSNDEEPSVAGLAEELQRTDLESDDMTPTPAEPPPAYTPSADLYQGEATMQYGPRRPFQQAPPPPLLPPHLTPQGTGVPSFPGTFPSSPLPPAPMLYIDPTGSGLGPSSGWGAGLMHPQRTGSSFAPSQFRPPPGPPPRHPSSASSTSVSGSRVSSAPSIPPRPMSEFARDFYASREAYEDHAGSSGDESNEGPEPPTRNHIQSSPNRASSSSTSTPSYAPPPGPPPSGRLAPPSSAPPANAQYAPPPGPPPGRTSSSDDGKPTSSPTPGRPYLNKGRVLVYPAGHECKKCLNTGYKHFDPSHPCRKCWERYGKPYAGAIVSAPWDAPSSSSARLQYQRPLPTFRPPHLRHQHSRSQPSLPSTNSDFQSSPNVLRSSRSSFHSADYPGAAARSQPMRPPPMGSLSGVVRGTPPPGATIVRPGDPRLGGRLCWRCDGDGSVSFLIFDVETCPICRGMGRIF